MTTPIRIADSRNRRTFIGGSDARVIMGTDEAALLRMWREKRGEAEPEDLSGNLIVQLGLVTEPLNRHWFERNTGYVITQVQRRVQHPVIRWMAATLDGMVEQAGAVFEAKFMLVRGMPRVHDFGGRTGQGNEHGGTRVPRARPHQSKGCASDRIAQRVGGHGMTGFVNGGGHHGRGPRHGRPPHKQIDGPPRANRKHGGGPVARP